MQKVKKMLMCLLFIILCVNKDISNLSAKELEVLSKDEIDTIERNASILGEREINIKYTKVLNDINNDPTYVLGVLNNNGYLIASVENLNISELCSDDDANPYSGYLNENLVYAGQYNYFYRDEEGIRDVVTNALVTMEPDEEVFLANSRFLESKFSANVSTRAFAWTGISESRFSRYANWINRTGHCGPYAAASLLAYYDDYISDSVIPGSIRSRNSTSAGTLIDKLIALTPQASGTLPNHVSSGITSFTQKYSTRSDIKTSTNLYGTWARVVNSCKRSRPICVGMTSLAGSKYGNHWVTVYQVKEDSSGKGWYKCVDNHGKYNAIIETSWTVGTVEINL